jgi:L-ascorbate metabolism protein UlaG (beta-lactamase superfamily)
MKQKMSIVLFIILVTVSLLAIYLSVRNQLGRNPKGELLKKNQQSANYQNGCFQNLEKASWTIPSISILTEITKKGGDKEPLKTIPTLPISLKDYEEKEDEKVLATWLGHSCLLLKMNGKTILIDPVFSKRASMSSYIGSVKFDYSNDYLVESLPKIDLVLLSHDHYDHLDYQVVQKMKDKVDHFYMPLGVGSHLEFWGVDKQKIREFDWWESAKFEGIEFTATPSRHFSSRALIRLKTLWCGWSISNGKSKIYFSGDSGYSVAFKLIGERLGPFDLAFVECGQYSKYWPTVHMTPEESVQAAIDVKSKTAIPIHWGKYKLSTHPWYEPPMRLIKKAKTVNQKVAVPQIGQSFSIDSIPEINNWFSPL